MFFVIFKFLQSVRSPFVTDDLVAFYVAITLSMFQILNLAMLYFEMALPLRLFIFGLLLFFNYLIFVHRGKYKIIADQFESNPPNSMTRLLVIVYVAATLVAFAVVSISKKKQFRETSQLIESSKFCIQSLHSVNSFCLEKFGSSNEQLDSY